MPRVRELVDRQSGSRNCLSTTLLILPQTTELMILRRCIVKLPSGITFGMCKSVVLEKTLESPLDCKEIQLVHPKGDQSWVFTGRTVFKLKLQYFGHLIQRTDPFEKTLMLGRLKVGGEGDDRG